MKQRKQIPAPPKRGRPRISDELARIRGTRRSKPAAPAPAAPAATPEQLARTAALWLFEAALVSWQCELQHPHARAAILARWRAEHPDAVDYRDAVSPHSGKAARDCAPWLPGRVCHGCPSR